MKKQKSASRAGRWLEGSLILSLLFRFVSYLYDAASRSVIGHILTSYRQEKNHTENTGIYRLLNGKRFSIKSNILLPCKRFCNRVIKQSLLLSLLHRTMRRLFELPTRFFGTMLVTCGASSILIDLILRFGLQQEASLHAGGLSAILLSICALPLLFSRKALCETVGGSAMMHFILCSVLGYHPNAFVPTGHLHGRTATALVPGILFGLLSIWVSPLTLILNTLLLLAGYLILCTPEVGVILAFGLLPFLSTMALAGLILFTVLSFTLKLLQGKRALHLELLDYAVLGLLSFVLIGGFTAFSPNDALRPALLMTCLMGGYFLVINTLRSTLSVKRCFGVFLFSAFLQGGYGIIEWFLGAPSTIWQDMTLFSSIRGRICGTFANPNVLAAFLILALPFLFALFSMTASGSGKFGVLCLIGICSLALVFTWSRGAWLGLAFGLILFGMISGRRVLGILLSSLFVLLAATPLLRLLLPRPILLRLESIGSLADSSTAYRVHVWEGAVEMIKQFPIGGIGTGVNNFASVYPHYAQEGIESAPHTHSLYLQMLVEHGIFGLLLFVLVLFLFYQSGFTFLHSERKPGEGSMRLLTAGGICAVTAFLVQGASDYVFYNYRVFALFWLLLGLITSARRAMAFEQTAHSVDDDYLNMSRKDELS